MGCEDFEVGIEQRLHGALGVADERALAAHLVECERCRAFEATARRTEAALRGAASEASQAVDWWRVEAGVARFHRRSRLLGALAALLALGLLLAMAVGSTPGNPAHDAPVVAGACLLVLAGAAWERWRRTRRMARLGQGAETLLVLRQELEARERLLRLLLVALPAYAVACAAGAWLVADAGPRLALAALGAGALALLPFVWLVKRPQLARERAALLGTGER